MLKTSHLQSWFGASLLTMVVSLAMPLNSARALQEQSDARRKVVNKVVPLYPDWARNMNLKGTVKVEALVASDGTVKSVDIKGGHPVLAQAAQSAVRKWKWVPAPHESREVIEVNFDPR